MVKDAVNFTAGTQKLFPRSFRAPDCETHSPGKTGHLWWRVQLKIRFQAKLECGEIPSFDQQDSIGTSLIFPLSFGWKGFLRVFAYNAKSI